MKDTHISTPVGVFVLTLMLGFSVFMVSAQEEPFEDEGMERKEPSQEISKQEINDFRREMKNLTQESKKLLKDLKKAKNNEAWMRTIQEVISAATDCAAKVMTLPSDEKRSLIDDCRSSGYWDTMNEIREEFVPPQEIKNTLNNIKNLLRDLTRFKKQMAKASPDANMAFIDDLMAKVGAHKGLIESAKGRDQRDAMNEFHSSNYWEDVNKVRSQVELPKQLKDTAKELKFAEKDAKSRMTEKALVFFGIEAGAAKSLLQAKKTSITQIQSLLDQGEYESAQELMQEEVYESWHPGDLRHLMGMMRDSYQRMKNVKDEQIMDMILSVMEPIIESFGEGDVRSARDMMVEFGDRMQKYEDIFKPYYRGGAPKSAKAIDNAMSKLEKLEELIQEKVKKGELKKPQEPREKNKITPLPKEEPKPEKMLEPEQGPTTEQKPQAFTEPLQEPVSAPEEQIESIPTESPLAPAPVTSPAL